MSDAAIANIVTGIVTITTLIIGFATLWLKLKHGVEKTEEVSEQASKVERKIDNNTVVTMAAAEAASESAAKASEATKVIDRKLNGELTRAIDNTIKPINDLIKEHISNDDARFKEIMDALSALHKNKS